MNQTPTEQDISRQWLLSREAVESIQLEKLNALLQLAIQSPFYRGRLGALSLPLQSLDQLVELPLLTKNDLVAKTVGEPGAYFYGAP